MTLSKALVPTQSLPIRALMVLGGSVFIALAAQISVPMIPVPMTLQTLAILIVGLPVFANGGNGLAFAGPTAGFLFGFVFMAWAAGFAADRGVKGVLPVALVALTVSALLYIPGVAWAMAADSLFGLDASKWGADSFASVWTWYIAPFLLGDAVKAVIAALVVSGGWAALKGRGA
jgi:biotin transport system substrate-specific component